MEITDYKRGGNTGALFDYGKGRYSACTASESSRTFKTQRGAERWLAKRGYVKVTNRQTK